MLTTGAGTPVGLKVFGPELDGIEWLSLELEALLREVPGTRTTFAERQTAREYIPPGYRVEFTGQNELMAEMEARMAYVLPITLALIVALLYLSLRGWGQALLVLTSLPLALIGSVRLLAALDYNLSTAVWVGLIAVGGVAAQTGIIIIVNLDPAYERAQGRLRSPAELGDAVVEGATRNVLSMVMTVATTVIGLMPLIWEAGVGADLSARMAPPVVGGLWSCLFLTLIVISAAYLVWRRRALPSSPMLTNAPCPASTCLGSVTSRTRRA